MSASPDRAMAERDRLAEAVVAELRCAIEAAATIAPITTRHVGFDLSLGLRVRRALEAERRAREAYPVGRKIGFTNRSIWPVYGVDAPIWAHVWSDTVIAASQDAATVSLAGLVQPRIEPELALRLSRPLTAIGADPVQVLACCDAYCHTLEIVQSHFPGWRFELADAAADCACHGRLVVGPWRRIDPSQREALATALAAGEVRLFREGTPVACGRGENALGHPALAVGAFLVDALAREPGAPGLAAGEIVTTGTLTDAYPVAPGETWSTCWQGLDVAGLTVRFQP